MLSTSLSCSPWLLPPPLALLFTTPVAATGAAAAAVAVPILIHLLNRRRYRIVPWAAMRFLLAAQKQNTRRMRVEQLILLVLRCLILLLLVLAMTSVMPWSVRWLQRLFPGSAARAAITGQRTHKVLVLDGSLSMAARGEDGTAWDRARRVAAELLEPSSTGDGFSVVLLAAPPQRVVPGPSDDPRKVLQEIQALRLPHGNAAVAEGLAEVERILAESPPNKFAAREVYFLTDLQRATWASATPPRPELLQRIQQQARVIFVDVGGAAPDSNLALTDLRLGVPLALTGADVPILASAHYYGGGAARTVRAELLVGKAQAGISDGRCELRVAQQELLTIAPGRRGEPLRFRHRFTAPGDYVLQVRLEHDALEPDDVRTTVVSVKDTVPVLLVNGGEGSEVATETLQVALNPYPPDATPRWVPARPRTMSVRDFNYASVSDLAAYECIFLCDVASLTAVEVNRLEAQARRGAGVVFCLGPRVNLEEYNRVLYRDGKGLLPARLVGQRAAPAERFFTLHAEEEVFKRPPLEAFAGDTDRASLLGARFRQFVLTEPAPRGSPRTLLSFLPDPTASERSAASERLAPAVLEWQPLLEAGRKPRSASSSLGPQRARGRVLLITTTVNRDWTDWPASPSYLPLVQELLRFAVSGRLREQAAEVGQALDEFLPQGRAGQEVTLRTPDGREETTITLDHDDGAVLHWPATDQSGLYRAVIGRHPQEYLFAVNVPTATDGQTACESDPTRIGPEELQTVYKDWDFQVVTRLKDVDRSGGPVLPASSTSADELAAHGVGIGAQVARGVLLLLLVLLLAEVVLAWHFGHYSAVGGLETPPAPGWLLPGLVGIAALAVFAVLTFVLAHHAWTGDFLAFLGDGFRSSVERAFEIPKPVAGEGSRWRLEATPFLAAEPETNRWLVGAVLLASLALIIAVYRLEGRTAGPWYRGLLGGLRFLTVFLLLTVLLPQLRLLFERQGWPDVAILVDDSASMSTTDQYADPRVAEAVSQLAGPMARRLDVALALLNRDRPDWLGTLLSERKFKVHLYHLTGREPAAATPPSAWPLHVTEPGQRAAALARLRQLRPDGETSPLGSAVRRILNDFRGASLAAVIVLSDGVTTDGEDLPGVARFAVQAGVPLFCVGIGSAQEARDLRLHDVQAEDSVYVHDRLVLEGRLTGQGYTNLAPLVRLSEKLPDGKLKELARQRVQVDPLGKPVKFRLVHQPTEPGEKVYVVQVDPQPDEIQPPDNNRLERTVFVRESKVHRVLYVEGYPRYEFRFIKTLLERESAQDKRNKTTDLRVLLLDADEEYASEDKSALADFPTREELHAYDVVLLGDVDPRAARLGERNLRHLADFVRERGGGLLVLTGPRYGPHALKGTPLEDVLPIEITGPPPALDLSAGFQPELTGIGRFHPIFRFRPDEAENLAIWKKLAPLYWCSGGYRAKPAAEVLLALPVEVRGRAGDRPPLMVQQFVGAGRSLFLGFDETWRWRFREDERYFNQFWIQAIRYLARSRTGRIMLQAERQTPYRRGEPIRLTVRFPDDAPPPPADLRVEVLKERTPPGGGEKEVEVLRFARVEGSRATYEHTLTRTPEGDYRFRLRAPEISPGAPRAEVRVLPPPGEMDQLRMNQADLERAAEMTQGRFYTPADADQLLDDLPSGTRVALHSPRPPWLLWNQDAVFALVLAVLAAEWVLRKRKHLL